MRRRINRLNGGGRVVLWDSFTDANNTTFFAHASDDGAPWPLLTSLDTNASGTVQTGLINTNRANAEPSGIPTPAKFPTRRRHNGRVSADIIRTAAAQAEFAGIMMRAGPDIHFVQARHSPNGTPQWQITRFYDASVPAFAGTSTFNQTLTQDQVYRLDFDARGPVFLLWVDGVLRIRVEGYTRRRGGPGVRLQNNTANPAIMRIDNWMVTR